MQFIKPILITVIVSISSLAFAQEHSGNAAIEAPKRVKLFPNPAVEFLTIQFETPQSKKVKFTLHNIIGNELETEVEIIDDFEVRIKVKDLPIGFYLLHLSNHESGFKGVYKFLKR